MAPVGDTQRLLGTLCARIDFGLELTKDTKDYECVILLQVIQKQ